jgi:hypothetical protein
MDDMKFTGACDRITIKLDLYWETFDEPPMGRHVVLSRLLKSKGIEPYVRKQTVGEDPVELFIGDIDRADVGYILLINTEGTKLQTTPTEEERQAILGKVVVFNGFEIYPHGMPFLGQPKPDDELMIYCRQGKAVVQVCVFPR